MTQAQLVAVLICSATGFGLVLLAAFWRLEKRVERKRS
jgi:hypothetical protein